MTMKSDYMYYHNISTIFYNMYYQYNSTIFFIKSSFKKRMGGTWSSQVAPKTTPMGSQDPPKSTTKDARRIPKRSKEHLEIEHVDLTYTCILQP